MALVFRAIKNDPPQAEDFQSYWDQRGRPARKTSPTQIRTYQSVSTFDSLEKAREKALAIGLGSHIAELEVPDSVKRTVKASGHIDLEGTTPDELLGYVVRVHPLHEGGTLPS